jgi:hypothetical protein
VPWKYPVGYEKYNLTSQVNSNTLIAHKVGCLGHSQSSLHHSLICVGVDSLFSLLVDTLQTNLLTIIAVLISLRLSSSDQY